MQTIPTNALFWIRRLSQCPGVLAIALSGSMATNTHSKDSDIDIFIITKPGMIWTARFFVMVLLRLVGGLATEDNHAGGLCPNHFITTDGLELPQQTKYTAFLFSHATPLVDPFHVWTGFQKANKEWIGRYGYTYKTLMTSPPLPYKPASVIAGYFEMLLKRVQQWKIARNPLSMLPNAEIIMTSTELRFHPRPKAYSMDRTTPIQ